jgi:hypothetical protein
MILDRPWPEDLDPAQAGFKTRTITILRRHGYWDDPTRLDSLTVEEFLAYETAGIAVLTDLIEKGNAAIAWHENLPHERRRGHSVIIHWDAADRQKLRRLTDRKWAHQVWRRDPRFADLLPKVDATVADIATSGTIDDRKALVRNFPLLQDRLRYYRSRREESLRLFVSDITSQTGERLPTPSPSLSLIVAADGSFSEGRSDDIVPVPRRGHRPTGSGVLAEAELSGDG